MSTLYTNGNTDISFGLRLPDLVFSRECIFQTWWVLLFIMLMVMLKSGVGRSELAMNLLKVRKGKEALQVRKSAEINCFPLLKQCPGDEI